MQGSVEGGIILVMPYFGLGLMMNFLARVCIGRRFSEGDGERRLGGGGGGGVSKGLGG